MPITSSKVSQRRPPSSCRASHQCTSSTFSFRCSSSSARRSSCWQLTCTANTSRRLGCRSHRKRPTSSSADDAAAATMTSRVACIASRFGHITKCFIYGFLFFIFSVAWQTWRALELFAMARNIFTSTFELPVIF